MTESLDRAARASRSTEPPAAPGGRTAPALQCLLVATRAAALARCAEHHGTRCLIIDCNASPPESRHRWITTPRSQNPLADFDGAALIQRLRALPEHWAGIPLIYGAGFDHRPELLARLAMHRRLHGNAPEILGWLADPCSAQELARNLKLPFLETSNQAPDAAAGWLSHHIGDDWQHLTTRAANSPEGPGRYFQREPSGRLLTAPFLADGTRARLIGLVEWTADSRSKNRVSAVSQPTLAAPITDALERAADLLARHCGLVGLNQLGVCLADGDWMITHITPRPTDDIELFDEDLPGGALAAHLAAVRGELPRQPIRPARVRGLHLLRARSTIQIDNRPAPPDARGWPSPGRVITAGETLCTVFAEGLSQDEVRATLAARTRQLSQRKVRPGL